MPVDVEEIIQIDTSSDFDGNGQNPAPLSLSSTGVAPGTYTNATVTVDSKGRVTAISSGSASYNPEITVIGSATYEVDERNIVEYILIIPNSSGSVRVGTDVGLGDILQEDVINGIDLFIQVTWYNQDGYTMHFTGSNFTAKIYFK